jgi:hypothetical protein
MPEGEPLQRIQPNQPATTMKKITSLLAVSLACIGLQSASAAIILTAKFDNSFDNALTAPFVGNATLSYLAGSPLSDGVYAWNSFSGLTFSATFPGLPVTFTQAHLLSTDVYVAVVGSNFFFANPNSASNSPFGGSADFSNGSYIFTNEPIDNVSLTSTFRGTSFTYPLYQIWDAFDATNIFYMGTYGADRQSATTGGGGGDPSAVPEPGQVAASLLLLGGIGGYVFVKRRKAAKPALVPAAA